MDRAPRSGRPAAKRSDVAQLAGVSTAVVSYVVNGTKNVSPETTARVREAIDLLGYRPNRTARALRLGASEMLGMVLPDATNPYFAMLARAVEEATAERGLTVLTANANGSLETENRRLEHLVDRGVDGVVLCSTVLDPDLRPLVGAGIPTVLLNHWADVAGVSTVGVDLWEGARLAVEHLAGHGLDRIGLVIGTNVGHVLDPREASWRHTVARLGRGEGPIVREPFTPWGGYAAGTKLVTGGDLPPALFVSSDRQALGLLRALHEAGIRVPEDVAIVSLDGSDDAAFSWPPLSTVAAPVEEMARVAVAALIEGAGATARHVLLPTLVCRASCGCTPARRATAAAR
ncbi:LacI family DNA-binding transcriptional regulator [Microbacterium sp.]|uniref:LacI family DNA-binding transcriptional regulator n=1 Tax=Microbacterium sp. TaxID=51671 RepID=UPI0039E2311E